MQVILLLVALCALGAALVVAGTYLLLGLGASLVLAGVLMFVAAAFVRSGIAPNGQ